MRNFLRTSALLAALVPCASAFGIAKPSDCPDNYVFLETTDGNSGTAGDGFDHSSMTVESRTGHWSNRQPPAITYNYFVGGGPQLATPNNANVAAGTTYKFPGASLMLGKNATIAHCSKKDSCCDFGTKVTVISGAFATYNFPAIGTGNPATKGTVTIQDGATFRFFAGVDQANVYHLGWNAIGGSGAIIELVDAVNNGRYGYWKWHGDFANFYGTVRLPDAAAETTTARYSSLELNDKTVPGAIDVGYHQWLILDGNCSIGSVKVTSGATLCITNGSNVRVGGLITAGSLMFCANANGKLGLLTVSDSFINGGKTLSIVMANSGLSGAIIKFPASTELDVKDVRFRLRDGSPSLSVTASIIDNGDNTKTLWVNDLSKKGDRTFEIDTPMTITDADGRWRLTVKRGVEVELAAGKERMAVRGEDGATINLMRALEDWETIPSLWLDASAANSISNLWIAEGTVDQGKASNVLAAQYVATKNGYPLINQWFDCRWGSRKTKFWSDRYDQVAATKPDGSEVHWLYAHTHPRLVLGGLNGKNYVSFGVKNGSEKVTLTKTDGSTYDVGAESMNRGYFYENGATKQGSNRAYPKPKYVFMVFGAQNGGGNALLANSDSPLGRGNTVNDPITTNTSNRISAWVNGVKVSPTARNTLKPDWQVITLGLDAAFAINGLGYSVNSAGDNCGQNYAEIIMVNQDLSEKQRQTIEMYLIEKWGLDVDYPTPEWTKDNRATLYGTGRLNLGCDVKIGGDFAGTINLNGKELTIEGSEPPPTEEAINTNMLEGWYDPDLAGTTVEQETYVTLVSKATGQSFRQICEPSPSMILLRDKIRPVKIGQYCLSGNGSRSPWLCPSARAFGPERKWMEFSNLQPPIDPATVQTAPNNGKLLRFSKINNEQTGLSDQSTQQQPMRTLFMVMDSLHGGGHPFADGANVAAPVLYFSRTGERAAPGKPIYPNNSSTILTEGITCLDGREVDGSKESFGQRPEVFTVVPTNLFNIVAFGQLNNSENKTNGYNEVIGEIMIYNRKLGEAERQMVETYLSYKWMGLLPHERYSALGAAVVVGDGKVSAPNMAMLPRFDDTFIGTVTVPAESGMTVTLDTDGGRTSVVNPINLGAGTFDIDDEVTITVDATGTPPNANMAEGYRIVQWGRKPATTTWKVKTSGKMPDASACSLIVRDDGLYLRISSASFTIVYE